MPNNHRMSYYNFKLKNSIDVYVIKNKKIAYDGISIIINSGAKYDKDILGLAHFTEHMLFLGSQKYNKETEFVDYISQYQGKFNGFTALEKTAFYFKISNHKDYFDNALEIFKHFFIRPLFSEKFIEKEINSVNSEYERNCQDDNRKKDEVIKQLSNKDSLFFRFKTGNRKTLLEYASKNNISLKSKVLQYYTKFFNPEYMKIVVYGSKSFSEYKRVIEKHFEEIQSKNEDNFLKYYDDNEFYIKNNNKQNNIDYSVEYKMLSTNKTNKVTNFIKNNTILSKSTQALINDYKLTNFNVTNIAPFDLFNIGKVIYYQSESNHREMDIIYFIPDIYQLLPHNPGLYIKTLVNYKGKGSLIDILINNNLASGLISKIVNIYKGINLFKISMYLTKNGINNSSKVFKFVNLYFKFLKNIIKDKLLYNKIKVAYNKQFFNKKYKKQKIMKFLKSISMVINQYNARNLVSQHKLLHEYNYNVLEEFLKHLCFNNSIVSISNNYFDKEDYNLKDFAKNYMNIDKYYNQLEPHLKTNYIYVEFSQKFYNELNDINDSKIVFSLQDKIKSENKINKISKNNKENKHQIKQQKTKKQNRLVNNICKRKNKTKLNNKFNISKKDKNLYYKKCARYYKKDSRDITPVQIAKDNNYSLFFKRDRSFLNTKVNLMIGIILPYNPNDNEIYIIKKLLIYYLNFKIKDIFSNKKINHNKIQIKSNFKGIDIYIYGCKSSIKLTSQLLLNSLLNLDISENIFNIVKDLFVKQHEETINIVPKKKAMSILNELLNKYSDYPENIISNVNNLKINEKTYTLENLNFKIKDMFKLTYLKILIHGNINKNNCIDIKNSIIKIFNHNSSNLFPSNYNYLIDYTMPISNISGSYVFRNRLKNKNGKDHATLNAYYIGENTPKNLLLSNLILSLVGNIYFTELRIQLQLGYTTKGYIYQESKYLYYIILVQGSTKQPIEVDYKIEDLIDKMREIIIKKLNDKDFNFINILKHCFNKSFPKHKDLNSRTNFLWNQIYNNTNRFNIKNNINKLIEEFKTKKDESEISRYNILEFYDNIFIKKLSKLSVQLFSLEVAYLDKKVSNISKISYINNFDKSFNNNFKEGNIKKKEDAIIYQTKLVEDKSYFKKLDLFIK